MKSMIVCVIALALLATCHGFAITIKCYKNAAGENECIKHIDYYSNTASISSGNSEYDKKQRKDYQDFYLILTKLH
ncbi:hypothetical protein NPIL_38671 [Nephila pilipes]|uniref:Uncharacterized protein n=1 Tax=Nephila pilipes TaxID=299642 RepID=A0A8X6U2J8_NEPPI|nr:hypothetical protein NPIL_38671 [Nephila pilipes]